MNTPMAQDADEHAGHADPAAVDHSEHEGMAADPGGATDATMDMPEGAVMISPERQQLIGVRTATVREDNIVRRIRTVGRVDYDETRVAHIHTRVTGWIEKLHVDFTGKLVEVGQPLLEIYSPELVATQEEYLLALRAQETLGESAFAEVAQTARSLLAATRRRLLLWDVTEAQIAALEERREPETRLAVYSPIEGFVIHKNAYEGQHVGPDRELFTIADLSEVWVIADIYESDLPLVREGQRALISLSYQPGSSYVGIVDYIYPYLAGETRTAKVRLVLANPRAQLKPNMYANVEITARLGRSLVVPEDAVLDTGERQVVFVVLPGGHFIARDVRVGARFDDLLQIVDGLEALSRGQRS
jgi:RND family efflux transporter MFP subunit